MSSYLVNQISNIQNLSYLELGIFDGYNFTNVKSKIKTSVDISHPADYKMSTDMFFKQLPYDIKYDVIYIDADHSVLSIQKDFNNSILHLNEKGVIFLHDLYPEHKGLTRPEYCGTGYQFMDALLSMNYPNVWTLDSDYGLTFIKNPKQMVTNIDTNLSYENFRKKWIQYKLISKTEAMKIVEYIRE